MTTIFSAEEQAIIDYVESGYPVSVDDVDTEIDRYAQIARAQMSKKATISIQLLESDLERIKAKSVSQGLQYEALISSLVHQYAMGKITLET
ncbi:hypothetical protein [Methylovulum miyakonense]|uniref:hypothetical protein n=1 Tax=Methylovulum miyakonense TaxID=645578 RepID=UPI000379F94C|nr:hypothetical protein [Methylovulum miyakonense]